MIYKDQPIELFTTFVVDGTPTDPTTVTLEVLRPDNDTPVIYSVPADIQNPSAGRYVIVLTPDAAGRWEYRWVATGAVESIDVDVFDVVETAFGTTPVRRPIFLPTVTDVANLIRARTKDSNGNELGTFTDTTRPTKAEVESIITLARGELITCAGDWLPLSLQSFARTVIALRAAAWIERSYWPEQTSDDDSSFRSLRYDYERLQPRLCDLAAGFRPPELLPDAGGSLLPVWYMGDIPGYLDWEHPVVSYDASTQTWYVYTAYGIRGMRPVEAMA